jgi:hypothetical protein
MRFDSHLGVHALHFFTMLCYAMLCCWWDYKLKMGISKQFLDLTVVGVVRCKYVVVDLRGASGGTPETTVLFYVSRLSNL